MQVGRVCTPVESGPPPSSSPKSELSWGEVSPRPQALKGDPSSGLQEGPKAHRAPGATASLQAGDCRLCHLPPSPPGPQPGPEATLVRRFMDEGASRERISAALLSGTLLARGWGLGSVPPPWPPNTHRTRPHEDPGNQPLGVLPPPVDLKASVLPQGVARIPKDRQTHTHRGPPSWETGQ